MCSVQDSCFLPAVIDDQKDRYGALICGCSSGVIWERKKRKRYTSVTMLLNQILEEGYQRYQNELEMARGQKINGRRILSDGKVEVLYDHSYLLYFYKFMSS